MKGKKSKNTNRASKKKAKSSVKEAPSVSKGVNTSGRRWQAPDLEILEAWFYPILSLMAFIFLGLGLTHLGKFMSVDEPKWLYERVPKLFNAISKGNFENTVVSDKPGLLPAYLSGFTNLFINLKDYNPLTIEKYLFWWRFPILFFNFCMLFVNGVLLKKLLNTPLALLIIGLIAFNSTLIGLSQTVNADATLWSVAFACMLSFMLYVKEGGKKHIYITGLFFVLAAISKFNAVIFYIYFPIFLYALYFFKFFEKNVLLEKAKGMLIVFAISVAGVWLLYPAAWTNLQVLWDTTFNSHLIRSIRTEASIFIGLLYLEVIALKGALSGKLRQLTDWSKIVTWLIHGAFLLLITAILFMQFYDPEYFEVLRAGYYRGTGDFLKVIFMSERTSIMVLNVVMLVGFLLFLISPFIPTFSEKLKSYKTQLLFVLLFMVIFLLGAAYKGFLAGARYQVMLYALYAFIAGITLLSIFPKRYGFFVLLIALLLPLLETFLAAPFYYQYTNPLNHRNDGVVGAFGYGGYELAQLANQLPGADTLKVWSDQEGFEEFFIGKTILRKNMEKVQPDYLLLTLRGYQKHYPTERQRKLKASLKKKSEYYASYYTNIKYLLQYYNKKGVFSVLAGGSPDNYVKLVDFRSSELEREKVVVAKFDPNVDIPLSEPYSISFWVKANTETPGVPILLGGSHVDGIGVEARGDHNKGQILFKHVETGDCGTISTGYIYDQRWHHVVWYQNGGKKGNEIGLYVDGKRKEKCKLEKDKTNTVKFYIPELDGDMEDMRIYNIMLNSAQIKAIYNNGKPNTERILNDGSRDFEPLHHWIIN